MSGTAKTVLIVGGVGVGVFLLVRALTPSSSIPKGSTASMAPNVLGGLASSFGGLISAVAGSSGAANQPSSARPTAQEDSAAVYKPGDSFDDYTTGLFGPGINSDGTGA